jgi:hypothetical protein
MAYLPEEFRIAEATLTDRQAYISSRTRSLVARQRKLTGQAFDFRLRSDMLGLGEFKKVIASLGAIQRDNDVVRVSIPVYSDSDAGTKTASVDAVKGQYSITLNDSDDIEIGDFFTFAGHPKAYQVTGLNFDEIIFSPNLVEDVAEDEVLTFDGMEFNFYLQGRPQQFAIAGRTNFMEIEIELVERWL